jgi:hypothetical protein
MLVPVPLSIILRLCGCLECVARQSEGKTLGATSAPSASSPQRTHRREKGPGPHYHVLIVDSGLQGASSRRLR